MDVAVPSFDSTLEPNGRVEADPSVDADGWRFARCIMVGHHLQMIANDFADLRDLIFSTWPDLRSWQVRPGT